MLKIGITGGIGSGKTIVSDIFKFLGVPVYNADENSKKILDSNHDLKKELVKEFGEKIYRDGNIDRKVFADLIFNDNNLLAKANSIIHPYVKNDFEIWIRGYKTAPYVIKEAAILFESGTYKLLDKTILIFAPLELRINRVMERDQVPEEVVFSKVKNQLEEEEKKKKADFVIVNDNKQLVLPQVLKLHKQFILI